jgi:hypothetical protein
MGHTAPPGAVLVLAHVSIFVFCASVSVLDGGGGGGCGVSVMFPPDWGNMAHTTNQNQPRCFSRRTFGLAVLLGAEGTLCGFGFILSIRFKTSSRDGESGGRESRGL